MRLGGRLAAAIDILSDIGTRHRPAADALKDWGLSHRFAGAGDRAAIGNIVYDALRRRRSAGWLLDTETPRATAFGALLLSWGESVASLDRTLAGDRFAPPLLDETERAAIAAAERRPMPPLVAADLPDWCGPLFQEAFGDRWIVEAQGLAGRPPLDMRVNTLLSTRERVLKALDGSGAEPLPLLPQALRIAPVEGGGRHPNVQAEPAFQQGWFEVQDAGSQIVAALGGAEPGQAVLDYCAGAGGKTLALSAAMANEGRIVAHDAEKVRLAPIFERLRRAGSRNVEVVARAAELAGEEGRFDLVLVDAPCTGSGTWRRRPDAKWRLSPRQLEARCAEQADILRRAAAYVRPGGRLAYVTCSVFAEENSAQVRAFLDAERHFALADHAKLLESHAPAARDCVHADPRGGLVLTPASSGTDGFYFAALVRSGDLRP